MEFKIINLKDTPYYEDCESENALYCELSYKRHAGSFAAMVFEFTDDGRAVTYNCNYVERIITEIDKYDNLRIGCDDEYIKSIVEKYNQLNHPIGIKIHYLLYTDLRSNRILFERLTELIMYMADKEMIYTK